MNKRIISICIVFVLLLLSVQAFAKEYKVAVKELGPVTDYFVSMITAVVEATGNTVKIQVVPPARAEYLVATNAVDIQYPIIVLPDQKKLASFKYDLSTVTLYKVAFVLYTKKGKSIDIDSIRAGNKKGYKIEVDPSRMDDFDFKVIPSNNFEASLQKVDNGTIDAAILPQSVVDPSLKKLGLKTVKRQLWLEYDEAFSMPKGSRGGEIDKMLSAGIAKLKADGKFDKMTADMVKMSKYNDWQP